jgi:nicotinamide-nucleotide amidase
VPGSSSYYIGGAITYCNEAKTSQLGVSEATLAAHGAVSEPVAAEMADGVRQRFNTDWGIGITGIAGPSGGTEDKPVGTVCIGLSGRDGSEVVRRIFHGDRPMVRLRSALTALNMLRLKLIG